MINLYRKSCEFRPLFSVNGRTPSQYLQFLCLRGYFLNALLAHTKDGHNGPYLLDRIKLDLHEMK